MNQIGRVKMNINNYCILEINEANDYGYQGTLYHCGRPIATLIFNGESAIARFQSKKDRDACFGYLTYDRLYDLIDLGMAYQYFKEKCGQNQKTIAVFHETARMIIVVCPTFLPAKIIAAGLNNQSKVTGFHEFTCEKDFNFAERFRVQEKRDTFSFIKGNCIVYSPLGIKEKKNETHT